MLEGSELQAVPYKRKQPSSTAETELRELDLNNDTSPTKQMGSESHRPKQAVSMYDYVSGNFRYNTQIIAVFLLSAFPVLALAGRYSFSIIGIGMIIVYILDFFAMKKWTLVSFWATLAAFWFSVYITGFTMLWASIFNIFTLMHTSLYILMFGIWGTLQSRWFKRLSPETVIIAERLLFAALPIIALPPLLSTIIAVSDIGNSPFYLAAILCLLVHFFVTPTKSSFKLPNPHYTAALSSAASPHSPAMAAQQQYEAESSNTNAKAALSEELFYVQGRRDSAVLTIASIVLPALTYLCIYHRMAFTLDMFHFVNVLALVCGPCMFISINPESYLWWLRGYSELKHRKLRYAVMTVCFILIVFWLQYRVIFTNYIHLIAVRPPFNYILVSIGIYSIAGIALVVARGELSKQERALAAGLCAFGAGTFAFAAGFPLLMIPFPAIAAYTVVAFYFTRSWTQYTAFGIAACASLVWWCAKAFWFLNFEFELSILPVSWSLRLTHTTVVIGALAAVSVAAVPMCFINHSTTPNNVLLIAQAALLAFLEQLLYEQGEGFYPPMLVIFTTALGLFLSKRMLENGRIDFNAANILLSIHAAKIAIFLSPIRMALLAAFLCSLSFTRLYLSSLKASLATSVSASEASDSATVTPLMGWIHVIFTGVSLFITRHVLLTKLVQFLMLDSRSFSAVGSTSAFTEMRVFGLFLVAWGIGILPLSYRYMRNVALLKRINLLIMLTGAVLSFWQPSLESESLEWVPWTVIVVMIFGIGSMMNLIPLPRNFWVRCGIFALMGFGAGLAFAGAYYTLFTWDIVLLTCIVFVLATLIIFFAHFPLSSHRPTIILFFAFIGCLPIIYLDLFRFDSISSLFEIVTYMRVTILGVFAALCILIAIIIKFKLSGYPIIRIAAPEKKFLTSSGTEELAIVCNLATMMGYFFSVVLNTWIGSTANNYQIFVLLSSLFLLLHRDGEFLVDFSDTKRYLVAIASAIFVLLMLFLYDFGSLSYTLLVANRSYSSLFAILRLLRDMTAFALAVPAPLVFLHFLLKLKRPHVQRVAVSLVACILALVLTTLESTFWLACIGVAGCLLQLFTVPQWSRQAIRLL